MVVASIGDEENLGPYFFIILSALIIPLVNRAFSWLKLL